MTINPIGSAGYPTHRIDPEPSRLGASRGTRSEDSAGSHAGDTPARPEHDPTDPSAERPRAAATSTAAQPAAAAVSAGEVRLGAVTVNLDSASRFLVESTPRTRTGRSTGVDATYRAQSGEQNARRRSAEIPGIDLRI